MKTQSSSQVYTELKSQTQSLESSLTQYPAGEQNRLALLKKHLPEQLQKGMNAFKTEEEQELYLYLSLAAVSGLLTKVTGEYRGDVVRPNLYCAGIARPASGKGLINYVQAQLFKIHAHYLELSTVLQKQYKNDLNKYNQEKKKNPDLLKPERPPFKVVFIPANCTSAKLQQHLQDNQLGEVVPQILIDAEIDSLVGSLESDLANISSILRKAFHGETISMSRKTDDEYIEIRNCQLALALTGTSNQFVKLVNNSSDGLVSRFMTYMIDSEPTVNGIRRCATCPNVRQTFEELADGFYRFWQFMQQESFEVELTDDQLVILELYLDKKLKESIAEHGDDVAQIILRHGLMAFKICMVLTAFRKFEYAESNKKMSCSEEDFQIALRLVETSIHYSVRFFEMLPRANYNRKSGHKQRFLEVLPSEFTRKMALEIGSASFKTSEASIDRWLSGFVKEGKIIQMGAGQYQKA